MQTTIISPTDKIEAFIKYLPKPEWFKQKFKPEFDYYRKRNSGYVILAKDSNGENVLGCIYCEPTGKFLYKGGSVAIFGWPYADSPEIMHHLFEKAKKLC